MNRRLLTLPLAFLYCLGLLAGCSADGDGPVSAGQTGSDDFENMDFSQPYGGLTATDEPAAFDDASLQAMMIAEDGELVEDEFASDEDVQALMAEGQLPGDAHDTARPRFTFLRLAWGMVRGPGDTLGEPSGPCDVVEWTGEIHTDRGIVLVRRVMRFEEGDHLVRPRLDRRTVAFVSNTTCGFDGLLLQIIERPADHDPENTEPNRLHINTGPFSGVYEIDGLAGLSEIHEIDDAGNLFQLNGFNLSDVDYCPKGFLSGRYRILDGETGSLDEPGNAVGKMAGAYLGLNGRIRGFMMGAYGFDEQGERVFYGKYIDRLGRFRGLLRGTWVAGDGEDHLAGFEGHWVTRNGNREGLLGGLAHAVEGYPGGFYEGRWTTVCDDEAEDQVQ